MLYFVLPEAGSDDGQQHEQVPAGHTDNLLAATATPAPAGHATAAELGSAAVPAPECAELIVARGPAAGSPQSRGRPLRLSAATQSRCTTEPGEFSIHKGQGEPPSLSLL